MRQLVGILILSRMIAVLAACNEPNSGGPGEREATLKLALNPSAFFMPQDAAVQRDDGEKSFAPLFLGELQVHNTDTDQTSTFTWSADVDASAMTAQSNRTIILTPGNYELSLLITKGDQQYAGTSDAAIADGENNVYMILRPVIGNILNNVTVVSRTTVFDFRYDPIELSSIQWPRLGVIVDDTGETILALNSSSGRGEAYLGVAPGPHTVALRLYDGALQIGRSLADQESVVVSPGEGIIMDLVALQGEMVIELIDAGGNANLALSVPAEVVEEAGGIDNLRVQLSAVGPSNSFQERVMSVAPSGAQFTANATLSDLRYGDLSIAIDFIDASTSPSTLLGSCTHSFPLTTRARTVSCELSLLRRSAVRGNLLATVGIDVVDAAQHPVAGAVVSSDGQFIGITGSGFGTAGYLRAFLRSGSHTITATSGGRQGMQTITVSPLSISNIRIILSAAQPAFVSGTIVDGRTNARITQPLQVAVEGADRNLVTDVNGSPTTSFSVTDGTLSFRVAADVVPSEAAPVNITLVVQGDGFVPTSLPKTIIAPTVTFSIKMTNLAAPPRGVATGPAFGNADAGGTVRDQDITFHTTEPVGNVAISVTVPVGTTIKDANDQPLKGALTMNSAYFSPNVASSLAAFPGGFSVDTTNASGNTTGGEFITAGLISVEVSDDSGHKARTFDGNGIQISMGIPAGAINPVANRLVAAGDVIPVFSNDTSTGRWFDEGTVTVTTAGDGSLVAEFNAVHLSLWNLDFKVDRCPSTDARSRAITVGDNFCNPLMCTPICSGKMRSLRVELSIGSKAYKRVLDPFGLTDANIIQFRNTPQVDSATINIFEDVDGNESYDPNIDHLVGTKVYFGSLSSDTNLCPGSTDTGVFPLSVPEADLPGHC